MRRILIAAAASTLLAGLVAAQPASATDGTKPPLLTDVQLLAINDFHGNLEPPQGSSGTVTTVDAAGNTVKIPAGGVEYLATHLKNARAGKQYTATVGAGDLIGASPLLSAAFHDEPTVQALTDLGLEVSSVGNHEFDEGKVELLRMQRGGCHPTEGCYDPAVPYTGAGFQYLAANVIDTKTKRNILPPYWVKAFGGGVRIGFIGMTLKGTPDVVTKSGVAGLEFRDEVETANFEAGVLKSKGVNAIVVLLHEGGTPTSPNYDYDCNAGGNLGLTGPIVNIAQHLDPAISTIITGHTHQSYACSIPDPNGTPRMVTSAGSFGREYTDINLTYDLHKHDVVKVSAQNKVVTRDVPKDPAATALVTKYKTLIEPIANKVTGYIAGDINGRGSPKPESPLGDVIADSQLAATAAPDKGAAVLALMNPGGIRSDLAFAQSGTEGNGVVTYGEAFTVQPFNNFVCTISLTGAQLVTVLQQQYSGANLNAPKTLQLSQGLTYTTDTTKVGADKIVVSSILLNGAALNPTATYRVTVNNFLADGGDGFAELAHGTDRLVTGLDIDAFVSYLTAHSSAVAPLAVPAANRITFL